jgi:hypothetical protein
MLVADRMPAKPHAVSSSRIVLTFAALSLLLTLLFLAPSFSAPLVSDDYSLTVESRTLAWGQSFDSLYRPLRNIAMRAAAGVWPVTNPLPYRVLLSVTVFFFFFLFPLLIWRVEGDWRTALVGLILAAFYPRMQELYYWFSVWQDLCVLCLGLAAIHFFLLYRDRERFVWLLLSCFSVVLALGFKETAATLLPLLVLIDIRRSWLRGEALWRWRAYVPLGAVTLAYLAIVFLNLRQDAGTGSLQRGTHGLRSPAGVGSNVARSLLAVFWPWFQQSSVWIVLNPVNCLGALGTASLTFFCLPRSGPRFGGWRGVLLLAIAIAVGLAPTVLFGPHVTDRYIITAALAVFWVLAIGMGSAWASPGKPLRLVATVLLAAYCSAGYWSLRQSGEQWFEAGRRVDAARQQTASYVAAQPQPPVVYGIRIPAVHGDGRHFVLANGFIGILLANGLSMKAAVVENFGGEGPVAARDFWRLIEACPDVPPNPGASTPLIFDLGVSPARAKDPTCALPILSRYENMHPELFLKRTRTSL